MAADLNEHETIDLDKAREMLRRAVELRGEDFRYVPRGVTRQCLYVTLGYAKEHWPANSLVFTRHGDDLGNPESACIVGTGLDLIGETWHHAEEFWASGVSAIGAEYPNLFTSEAEEFLRVAQTAQDDGATWGEAVTEAEAALAQWNRESEDH